MLISRLPSCCGFGEIINTPSIDTEEQQKNAMRQVLDDTAHTEFGDGFSTLIFTDRCDQPYYSLGEKFAAFIRKNSLGRLITGPSVPNVWHNSTHNVRMWTWILDRDKISSFIG